MTAEVRGAGDRAVDKCARAHASARCASKLPAALGSPHACARAVAPAQPPNAFACHPTTTRSDPWWCEDKAFWANVLRLPKRTWKQMFHYTRPDTNHKTIRQPEWDHLRSEWRYVHR